MMRVPTARLQRNVIHFLQRSVSQIETLHRQIATGKRLHRPSDDPSAVVEAMSLRKVLESNLRYQKNVADAEEWNTATEQPVSQLVELFTRMKEIALGSADGTDGYEGQALQVEELLEELVDVANTRYGDRYLFSGFQTRTAPYAAVSAVTGEAGTAGNVGVPVDLQQAGLVPGSLTLTDASGTVTYVEGVDYDVDYTRGQITPLPGSGLTPGAAFRASYQTRAPAAVTASGTLNGDIERQIGGERLVTVNLTGPEVFTSGVDLFQLAIDLKNALYKERPDDVRALLDSLDTAIGHTTQLLGVIGARMETLTAHRDVLETQETHVREFISDVEDTDLAEAAVRLQGQQTAYEAALAAATRMMQTSLVDFL